MPTVIREALALSEHILPSELDLRLRLPETLSMRGDAERIRRLAVNLVTNAVRHAANGIVGISLNLLAEDQVELCVQDSGEGISPKVLSVLGDPLLLNSGNLDADRKARGAGLGLSVCKEIVARHGGALFVESAVGVGTRVRAHLRRDLGGPSPVPAEDCLYASLLPCCTSGEGESCHQCATDCLFRIGGA